MSSHHHRLATLEAQPSATSWDDRDESFFAWLSAPSLIVVADRFAKDLAQRRYGDGWFRLSRSEQRDRIRAERANLAALFRTEQTHHEALKAWLAEADTLPPLPWGLSTSYADFVAQLARQRAMIGVHRAWDGPYGAEWRSRHPTWHPDMTPDEYDRFEASLGRSWILS